MTMHGGSGSEIGQGFFEDLKSSVTELFCLCQDVAMRTRQIEISAIKLIFKPTRGSGQVIVRGLASLGNVQSLIAKIV